MAQTKQLGPTIVDATTAWHGGEKFRGVHAINVKLVAGYCSRGRNGRAIGVAKVDKISWMNQMFLCIASIEMSCQEP